MFIKNFDLKVNETNDVTRRLETRFLVRDANGGVYMAPHTNGGGMIPDADLGASGPMSEDIEIIADRRRCAHAELGIFRDRWIVWRKAIIRNAGSVLGSECPPVEWTFSSVRENQK